MSEEVKEEVVEEKPDVSVERLREQFPDLEFEVSVFRGLTTVVIPKERMLEVLQFLRDDAACRFTMLTDIAGIDWSAKGRTPRFEVIYNLNSLDRRVRLRVKVRVDEGEKLPSAVGIWQAANWHERECYDMLGIEFEGHPDLRRIFMPDDFKWFPLRKDFPLKGYGE